MAAEALTHIGGLIADPTRASLLTVLMDGRARTGRELAGLLGVAPSTVSGHLSRLLDAGFVAVDAQGRHRYYRLAGAEVAGLLESLGATDVPAAPAVRAPDELRHARSCYDHLAGRLGVHLYDRLLERGHLRSEADHLALTPSGAALLSGLGVDVDRVQASTRPVARACLDWTERRHHLAGAAGAALFDSLLANGWIARGGRPRSVRVTTLGQRELQTRLGLA